MNSVELLPYYHPTTVAMVDDNQPFLQAFSLHLDERDSTILFSSPEACLTIINNRSQMTPLDRRCLSWYEDGAGDIIRLDLTLIEREISNLERFADISVVVVDYAMPQMDGLEFCRRIRNNRVKKVLLTGVADESIAVQAFNDGLIDRFLLKSDPDIINKINTVLHDLKQRYFREVSAGIQGTLALRSPEFMKDPVFIAWFRDLLSQTGAVEYYYVEDPPGMLLVDNDGGLKRLAVYTTQEIERVLFQLNAAGVDRGLLKEISEGKRVPCLWESGSDLEDEDLDLAEHLFDAIPVQGSQRWYCALVDDPPADIEYDPSVSSHAAFLERGA